MWAVVRRTSTSATTLSQSEPDPGAVETVPQYVWLLPQKPSPGTGEMSQS